MSLWLGHCVFDLLRVMISVGTMHCTRSDITIEAGRRKSRIRAGYKIRRSNCLFDNSGRRARELR